LAKGVTEIPNSRREGRPVESAGGFTRRCGFVRTAVSPSTITHEGAMSMKLTAPMMLTVDGVYQGGTVA
jgi:hypothetical protein